MSLKKIRWIIKRHPFLYLTRFKLLSRNTDIHGVNGRAYNNHNLKHDIPRIFHDVNYKIFKNNTFSSNLDLVKHLCIWLKSNIIGGPGLSEPSEVALRLMLDGSGGVCSDLVQVFNNFCVVNDIKVREWGCTKSPFVREFGGHSFNEIYCNSLRKWVLIDISYCMMFFNSLNEPLSVIELFQLLRNGEQPKYDTFYEINHETIEQVVAQNYFDLRITPFLIDKYSNRTYDQFLSYSGGYLPIFVIHFIIYLIGKSYCYYFPLNDYHKILKN